MQQNKRSGGKQVNIAVIADIHANAEALNAVLSDIESQHPDLVLCAGDLVGYGPQPNEVVEKIIDAKIPAVMGNYDDATANFRLICGCDYTSETAQAVGEFSIRFTRETLEEKNKAHLRSLPYHLFYRIGEPLQPPALVPLPPESLSGLYPMYDPAFDTMEDNAPQIQSYREAVERYASPPKPAPGEWLIHVFHGSPRRLNEYLRMNTPIEELRALVKLTPANVMICGHSHQTFHKLVDGVHIINVGSVGKPKQGNPNATYALIQLGDTVAVTFREVAYDVDTVVSEMKGHGHPQALIDIIQTGIDS
ncbi:hypothetical protein GTO91_09745 [Heliobacterium undosum]|uniref:Calcineurin-like phosphoesterase domain-containing protein n=1 Tax=Heliomicrobium undosum TaxID=121734 RepID=A0A845L2S2_9FIRM|nr:metallophosphoesterase family protein [Heliomicrobium undosum]MZP29986.1 hypothetical protein [Heliomicrobium undosum]